MSTSLSNILARMPKKYDEFRSCFVGTGELFFHLPISRNRWINDIDSEVICFYKILKSNSANALIKFPHKLSSIKLSSTKLKKMSDLLKTTRITRYCATGLLKNPGKNVFCYLYPPDFSNTEDHKKLAEVVKETEHMVLLRYKDSEFIRNLYLLEEGFYIQEENGELLITNYYVEDDDEVVKLF
jgi:site-specific DNA-adenine methylase